MPRRTIGPFEELADFTLAVPDDLDQDGLLEICWNIHDALEDKGCRCNGESREAVRDDLWGGDLSRLVAFAVSHPFMVFGAGEHMEHIVLSSLRVEIDDNDEVMCWIYEVIED